MATPQDCVKQFTAGERTYHYYSIDAAADQLDLPQLSALPISLKVLCENLLRHLGSVAVDSNALVALNQWFELKGSDQEIAFHPSRVLMQDFTGVPAVVDLAAMRDAVQGAWWRSTCH